MRKRYRMIVWICLIGGLVCGTAGSAWSLGYQMTPSSYFLFSKDRNVNSANKFYLPYYQYLDVDLTDLWTSSLSAHVSGWGRADFTSRGGDRGDGELLYGYLQWQDPSQARRVLRVGRQFFFGGATSLRTQYVDGVYFKTDIPRGFGVELLAGSQVTSSIGGRGGDFTGQGRLYHVWEDKSELGLSYLNTRESSERAHEVLGIDFWAYPFGKVELMGYTYYDIIAQDLVDVNLMASFFPIEKIKLAGDFSYTVPSFLLPHTSFFGIFSDSSYEKLGLAGTYFITDRVTVDADAQLFHYSAGGNVFRFGGEGAYQYGSEKAGRISLGAHRLDELEGGVTEVRAYSSYRFPFKLYVSGDIYGHFYDQDIRNRGFSFTTVGSLGYEVLKDLQLTGSLVYSQNPFFNNEFRGLLKLTYTFGGNTRAL